VRLLATPGVQAVTFVSKDEAMEVFREEFGNEAELLPDELFLPASYRVTLRPEYAQADSLGAITAEWREWARVEEVLFNQPLLVRVQGNLRTYLPVAVGLGLLVLLAALFLVGNTIRLTIYARRMLIRTMKLVGATDRFIRQPFLIEGIVQGLVAGVIACALLVPLYGALLSWVPQLQVLGWPGGHPAWVLVGVVLLGVVLGWFGSWVAVRRFIRGVTLSSAARG
jgi:cell division transport system permease protein